MRCYGDTRPSRLRLHIDTTAREFPHRADRTPGKPQKLRHNRNSASALGLVTLVLCTRSRCDGVQAIGTMPIDPPAKLRTETL